jgi:uncharacterized protein (TIGR03435 family)
MRRAIATRCAVATVAGAAVFSQTPSRRRASDGPTFDVVSIKRHPEDGPVSNVVYQRPDGGFSLTNLPASHLIVRAYGLNSVDDVVGLPDWARTDMYDVSATASLSRATSDERLAMWRAMLVDRFGLVAHLEKRTRPTYDLVLARRDGKLGPGLTPVAIHCDAEYMKRRADVKAALAAGVLWSRQDPDPNRQQRCALWSDPPDSRRVDWLLSGETTISVLILNLRTLVFRPVVDKTGLSGSYRVRLIYHDRARLSPDAPPVPDAGPSVFSAVQQQLGLRLRSSKAEQDTVVVDRIEPPTEN